MKIVRLILEAYGPFTGEEIDFASASTDLHLIYGLNEAGKSSALRAMLDLRFGIPLRSKDDFVHASKDLRISGIFLDEDGESVGFIRRKGRDRTLSAFDGNTGPQKENDPARSDQEAALSGGLKRSDFELMFGLNHERLVEGGRTLLEGEGELGSILFEASAGTRGIAPILASLDADAKQYFNAHGRSRNAVINDARIEMEQSKRELKSVQTRPADWQTLHRTHAEAVADLEEIAAKLEILRREENELTELRAVGPSLHELDRLEAALAAVAGQRDLPENARETRLAAAQSLVRAESEITDATEDHERSTDGLSRLESDPLVIEHADAIERLATTIEPAARSRIELRQLEEGIGEAEQGMAQRATRIDPDADLSEILAAAPSAGDRIVLNDRLASIGRLGERLDGLAQRTTALEKQLKSDNGEVLPPIDPDGLTVL